MQPYTYLIGWPEQDLWYYGVRYANNCHPDDFWVTYYTSSDKVKEAIIEHGNPTVRQIRKTFTDKPSARLWEHRVLKRMKVVSSNKWLNRNDSLAPPINPFGNIAMRRPELRKKASNNNKGSNNPRFGHKQKQITCQHCNKTLGANTYARWHGNNCIVANPNAFRPTGKNNPFFGKQHLHVPQVGCLICKKITDIRNYSRHHGNKCNLSNLVANTDDIVYNKS